MATTTTTIRFQENEKELISAYAKLHGSNFSEVVRFAILEKIEDEYDLRVAEKDYQDWEKTGKKSYLIDELWADLEI